MTRPMYSSFNRPVDGWTKRLLAAIVIGCMSLGTIAIAQDTTTSPDSDELEPLPPGAEDVAAPKQARITGLGAETNDTAHGAECPAIDDFPTTVVADYVLGCMAANGNTHEALQQCSCSIDFIKARLSYKDYEQAATVMQVQRDIGQRGIFYRDSNWAKDRVLKLQELQAESTLRCF